VGEIRSDTTAPAVLDGLVAEGHLGIKSGRGFYEYPRERLVARRTRRDSLLLKLWKLLGAPE
jgi:3-hydroxyacyl-CoA dehydrogenase